MEDRVPGGRQRSDTQEDYGYEEEEDPGFTNLKLSPQHRHVSQSMPKFSSEPHNKSVVMQEDLQNRSFTLDRKNTRKFKGPSMKSFGNFMQRMVRHMSSLSLHGSPKTKRRPSRSASVCEPRRSRAGASNSSLDDSTIRPLNAPNSILDKTPGVSGIRNHGNTCFMNAILQCLSHTDVLAEYFVTDQYKTDVKRNNKQNAKKYGTKGELTEHLALLLKSLWSCCYTPDISSEFKSIVGKYGSQYRGYGQHDAQEFLLWLLDKVHEDLNIATKKKYRANKSSHGRSDEAVAAEALANHMRCNNSFVYDLFQALYRSSLTCPNCRRQSTTFDPFLSVSLPIPQKTKRPVYVTVAYLDAHPRQVRIGLLLNQCDTVKELRQTLATDTKIPEDQIILTEIYYDGFHRTFNDSQPLTDLHEADNIYAVETPPPVIESGPNAQYVSRYQLVVLLNKQISGSQGRRFGGPMVLQVPRDTSYMDLQKDILHNMSGMLREDVLTQITGSVPCRVLCAMISGSGGSMDLTNVAVTAMICAKEGQEYAPKLGVIFELRVVEGLPGKSYLPHDVDLPLFMPTVDRALTTHTPGSGPQHLKLVVEWEQQTKQCLVANWEDYIEEHASVRQVKLAYQQPVIGTLDECFELYTQEERLGADDAWYCSGCKKRQQGTLKTLSLWTLPDILVVHLKRFKQAGVRRTKLNTLISFPVMGLDMSRHVSKKSQSAHHSSLSSLSSWSPWRRQRRRDSNTEEFMYDLYAVCNHYGNMTGGHYTAFCKNSANGRWYTFDDTRVTEMKDEQIVTRAAYLLFYQRRTLPSANSASPTSPAYRDHWVYKITDFTYTPMSSGVSKSHEDLLDGDPEQGVAAAGQPFSRTVEAYATLRTPSRAKSSTASNEFSDTVSQYDNLSGLAESQDNAEISASSTNHLAEPECFSDTSLTPTLPQKPIASFPAANPTRAYSRENLQPDATSTPTKEKEDLPQQELQTWDYATGFYLQESCV